MRIALPKTKEWRLDTSLWRSWQRWTERTEATLKQTFPGCLFSWLTPRSKHSVVVLGPGATDLDLERVYAAFEPFDDMPDFAAIRSELGLERSTGSMLDAQEETWRGFVLRQPTRLTKEVLNDEYTTTAGLVALQDLCEQVDYRVPERPRIDAALRVMRWIDGWRLLGNIVYMRRSGSIAAHDVIQQAIAKRSPTAWEYAAGLLSDENLLVHGLRVVKQCMVGPPPKDRKLQLAALSVIGYLTRDQTSEAAPILRRVWREDLDEETALREIAAVTCKDA